MKKVNIIYLFMIALIFHCQKKQEKVEEPPVSVTTILVTKEALSQPIHTSGRLSSAAEMKLSFKIGGIVQRLYADEGQKVMKDQLLGELKRDEIEAQVQLARSAFEKAQRDHQRASNLYADSVATLEQMQDAETGMRVARSQLDVAEFNLEHAAIRAPENGRILKQLVEENELIGPGHPVFFFGSSGQAWIMRVGVTDRDVVQLSLGDSASCIFDAYEDVPFSATVQEIGGAPDPINGLFEVELAIQGGQAKLMNGFIGRVELYPSQKEDYFVIPFASLVGIDRDRGAVFVPDSDTTVQRKSVEIAFLINGNAAVRGLEGVNSVVVKGAAYLRDDSKIRIVEE